MAAVPSYPIRVEGTLDPKLSRWLWLVKWLLAIPHYVCLAFLWIAFVLLSLVALVAIVATGRYPRGIFDFNVGVLRWTWRVGFYSFSALGTDRYPPFTLGEAPEYPATLDVEYPEHLSRGLVLVKWWLLAIPHYLIVGIFAGGGVWLAWHAERWTFAGGGLIGLLVLVAAVALLFTGRYPSGIFDLVLGLDRWALRVAAYAALMTDRYPPFRLDMGGREPGAVALEPAAPAPGAAVTTAPRWSGGRILLVVLGCLAGLVSLAVLAAGTAAVVLDQTQRDAGGYLMSPTRGYATPTYALVSEEARVDGAEWAVRDLLGTVRIRVTSDHPVFVGIGDADEVATYLEGVRQERVTHLGVGSEDYVPLAGGAPAAAPGTQDFWVASTEGSGTKTLSWDVADGHWTVVLMNADGTAHVDASLAVGAELGALLWVGIGLLAAGALLALAAGGLVYGGIPKGRR
jgi:hypothetical protein